ncbi:MAG: nitroreductase family protein [Caldilineaceae bacterium]
MTVRDSNSPLALEKQAAANYPLHDIVGGRWSPRHFSTEPVPMEKIGAMLEAARWAASSRNQQPWRFIVITSAQPELHARFAEVLMEGNRKWAQNAPVFILGIAKRNWDHNDQPNNYAWYDLGQAVSALALQGIADGVYIHQMGGFSKDAARAAFAIPEAYEPVVAIAAGYMGALDEAPDDIRERELSARSRKPLSELVHGGEWGTPWD